MQNIKRKGKLYFTQKMKSAFEELEECPCTVVEAPMGYGKTTAVKEVLNSTDIDVIWQKVYDRGEVEFWEGFCRAVSKLDKDCAEELKSMNMLESSIMKREAMLLFEDLEILNPTFIVIDDYHYVKSEAVDEFLRLLILNMPENLHLIIITRVAFLENSSEMKLKGYINHIGVKTLEFSKEDIKEYFKLFTINISKEEQEQLYKYSEGWISALYLFAMDYKLHGTFVLTRSIPELVYETVYESLDDELKRFLITVCLLDEFNLEQAQYLWQKSNAAELLKKLIESNAFINKNMASESYSFHNIFSMCVREQFEMQEEEIKKQIFIKTGELYSTRNQYMDAMTCFCKAKDFDSMLIALENDHCRHTRNEHKDNLIKYYQECPLEVKKRHPRAILTYAMLFVTQFREIELYGEACREFMKCIENNAELSSDELSQLMGEYELMQTFTAYNDLRKMSEQNMKAFKLLKQPPRFYNTKNSFSFGSPSILYLYYRESGKLSELIQYLKESTSYYSKNSKGHGDNYKYIFEAEWHYFMGDFEEAEIIIHKAIPNAKEAQQADIVLCGLFLQAKISLAQGDFGKTADILLQMEDVAKYEFKCYQSYWLLYTFDMCKAYIYCCLEQTDEIPDWLCEYEYTKYMHFLSLAFVNMVHGKVLISKNKNLQLLGLSEQFIKQASIFPNLLATVYTNIYAAIANYKLNRMEDCYLSLKKALDIAIPDNLVMPFVENAKVLIPVLDILSGEYMYGGFILKIKAAYQNYNEAIQKIITENFLVQKPQLSIREKEIAMLVINGLNNNEIGQKLYISPNTVKGVLKNIFKKLNISSRSLLKEDMIN